MNVAIESKLAIAMNIVFAAGSVIATALYGRDAFKGIKIRMGK